MRAIKSVSRTTNRPGAGNEIVVNGLLLFAATIALTLGIVYIFARSSYGHDDAARNVSIAAAAQREGLRCS